MFDLAVKIPKLYQNPIWNYLCGRTGNDVLFECKGKKYTASWLKHKSLQLAISLQKSGVKRADEIVMAIPPGPEFMMIFFACSLLRVRIALVDPHMGIAHYESMIHQLSPKWVFIDSRLVFLQEHPLVRKIYLRWNKRPVYFPKIKDCRKIVCGMRLPLFTSHLKLNNLLKSVNLEVDPESDPGDEEFLIVYTSGTLAQPKGVVHSFASLSNSIQTMLGTFPTLNGKAIATHLPHFVLLGIRAGMQVHIWEETWSSKKRWNYVHEHQIQVLFGPPAEWLPLINYCKSQGKKLPDSLVYLLLGSAPVYPSFIQKVLDSTTPPFDITCIYGMTEHLLIAHADGDKVLNYKGEGTFVGKLFDGVNIKLDKDGEIEVQSDQLFKRYLHLSEGIKPHPTGDLGSWQNGNLCITGRKKNMIIRKNSNIYPELYEPTILSIPGIHDAALGSYYDQNIEDEKIVLVLEADHVLSDEKIKQLLSSEKHKIHPDAMPDYIMRMKIPRSGRQLKINREVLQKEIQCRIKS